MLFLTFYWYAIKSLFAPFLLLTLKINQENSNNMRNEEVTAAIAELTKTETKIRKKDLLKLTTVKENPITKHLFHQFTKDDKFEFDNLLDSLREFAMDDKLSPKIRFLFNLYDCDNDGLISRCDLFNIIKMFSDDTLTDSNVQNVVDKCFLDLGCEEIDFEKFKSFIEKSNPNIKIFMRCT